MKNYGAIFLDIIHFAFCAQLHHYENRGTRLVLYIQRKGNSSNIFDTSKENCENYIFSPSFKEHCENIKLQPISSHLIGHRQQSQCGMSQILVTSSHLFKEELPVHPEDGRPFPTGAGRPGREES